MNDSFVYCWSDKRTSKVYVGVHKGHEEDGYICSSVNMKNIYKQRPDDFTRKILAKGSLKDCAEFEVKINTQLLKDPETCYNRAAGKAILMTDEIKSKIGKSISISTKGKTRPAYIGKAISKAKKGVPLTKEHRQALSHAQTGRKDSAEVIAKRSIALKGINKRLKTDEEKLKISLSIKQLWQDPEYRARLVKAHTGPKY